MKPVNNIYFIPITEIIALECSEGRPLIGHSETETLAEGNTFEKARDSLKNYPGYIDNYVNLKEESKKKIIPFKLSERAFQGNIEKVLDCDKRFKNLRGDYTCGKPINENFEVDENVINGEFGICCIMKGYDIPEFCPYNKDFK